MKTFDFIERLIAQVTRQHSAAIYEGEIVGTGTPIMLFHLDGDRVIQLGEFVTARHDGHTRNGTPFGSFISTPAA